MVKLRVAARIIPETEYNHDQGSTTAGRKFLVVVRNPEDWCIGHLAVEIQRTYKRIYKHDLGKIKYLKNANDFDLDTEQFVADVFVNEGKAVRDGLDQDATIKVIQEQGQTIRYGSVVPDLGPVHYQKPPPPPVPRFSEVPSSLGKRRYEHVNGGYTPSGSYASKRTRLAEIDETQEQDGLMRSVEQSPELIQDTQTSPDHDGRFRIKLESPEIRRSFHNVAPATADELQYLPEEPPNFPHKPRYYVLEDNHLAPTSNRTPQSATRLSASNRHSQLLITPPTDPSVTSRLLGASNVNGQVYDSRSPAAAGASSMSNKFRSARSNVYDMLESDIEDSQMSPRATNYQPVPRLVKTSSIENTPGHQQTIFYNSFNPYSTMERIDADNDEDARAFIAEKRLSVSQHNDFSNLGNNVAQVRRDVEDAEIEIPAMASDPREGNLSPATEKPIQKALPTVKKGATSSTKLTGTAKSACTETELRPKSSCVETSKSQASSGEPEKAPVKRRKRKAERVEEPKRRGSFSDQAPQGDGVTRTSALSSPNSTIHPILPTSTPNIFEQIKARRRSSELDSPSEQLTQDLRNSERKSSSLKLNTEIAIDDGGGDEEGRASANGSPSATTPTSRRSSSSKMGTSPGRLGLGITDSPRKKKTKEGKLDKQTQKKDGDLSLTHKFKRDEEDQSQGKKMQSGMMAKLNDTAVEDNVMPSIEKPRNSKKVEKVSEIDFDKQCAVTMEDGTRCRRNLTCTKHGRHDKRGVTGRSAPFDELLKNFEKAKLLSSTPAAAAGGKASSPLPLPRMASKEKPAAISKFTPSAALEAAVAVASTDLSTSSRVIPPWLTAEQFERQIQGGGITSVPEKDKTATKEAATAKKTKLPVPVPPSAPQIKITIDNEEDSTDDDNTKKTDDEDEEESTGNLEEDKPGENGDGENSIDENEDGEDGEDDDEEDEDKDPQQMLPADPASKPNPKTFPAKSQTPSVNRKASTPTSAALSVSTKAAANSTIKTNNALSVPAASDRSRSRSSATPADDFNAIAAKLRGVKGLSPDPGRAGSFTTVSDGGNRQAQLQSQPLVSKSAMKKAGKEKGSSVSEMRSSVLSSDKDAKSASASSTNAGDTKKSANKQSAKTETTNTPASAKKANAPKQTPEPTSLSKTTSNTSASTTTSGSSTGHSTPTATKKQKVLAGPTPTPRSRATNAPTPTPTSVPKAASNATAKATTTPSTPAAAPGKSGLQALRARLAQKGRDQEIAKASPASAGAGARIDRTRGSSGLGKKKGFSQSDEEDSESSSSSDSDSDDDDEKTGKDLSKSTPVTGVKGVSMTKGNGTLKSKDMVKGNELLKGVGKGKGTVNVIEAGKAKAKAKKSSLGRFPDRSIRDPTPDDESSDED